MSGKKLKKPILILLVIVAILAGAFFFGGKGPSTDGDADEPATEDVLNETETQDNEETEVPEEETEAPEEETETPEEDTEETPEDTETPEEVQKPEEAKPVEPKPQEKPAEQDKFHTDPVPEGKPAPVEPQEVEPSQKQLTCTFSINCATILKNMDLCEPDKVDLVPVDGWILKPVTVTFNEGESVFDVLQRTCREHKIHMEYVDTPGYNSAYIEGIHNLYEFDVGDRSGWMYSVNGWYPNYGVSRYQLKAGDDVRMVYTCDLGEDIGGGAAVGG